MSLPLMPKAVAVWLVDNTSLTFDQIAEFVGMHPLEISGIADGEVAQGLKGRDPIATGELTKEVIEKCEADPKARLKLQPRVQMPEVKRKGPKYTPLSKRKDRPAAILWLIRNHPELTDAQISRLVGTTKPTIQSIRDKTHWDYQNTQPVDPVALGMCKQTELDAAVAKSAPKREAMEEELRPEGALLSTEESLADPSYAVEADEPADQDDATRAPDDFFNLPKGGGEEDEEEGRTA
jgi:hypothetical protein